MFKQILLILVLGLTSPHLIPAQQTRAYDGSNNNLSHPEWGATFSSLMRVTDPAYSDGMAQPSGTDRPNPRVLSNQLFGQNSLITDPLSMSDFTWVFGQFIDHDITLVPDNHSEAFMISVPRGDVHFDPFGEGRAVVPMFRSAYDPSTGDSPDNPRQYLNAITAWIDGSHIYGSSEDRAAWLRSFVGGKLRTSSGNLLPFNTTTGAFNSPIDPHAPAMDNANPTNNKLFVAGDVRANEQPLLLAFHTLFVREHNRLCDELVQVHPEWTDEELYQHARRLVIGLLQSITYEEWLPAMGVNIPEYTGYNPSVDPSIMNVFSAAAFRLGHTLVNTSIVRLTNEGDTIHQGSISLRDAFFNPLALVTGGGLDPLFKGMATQIQQNLDCKVVDDLRNFLFGAPGAGGLDLAAININRGRDRGLPDYNRVRQNFGLPAISQFRDITKDPEMINGLAGAYGSVDRIDPWVGMLAEDHLEGALFGPTVMTILKRQFTALRDGDRFYYQSDPGLTLKEIQEIQSTRFVDLIRRNTNIDIMQPNVFYAMAHDQIGITPVELPQQNLEMLVYPNPLGEQINVAVFASAPGRAELQVIDMLGRLRYRRSLELAQGSNSLRIDQLPDLTHGVYHILVVKDNKIGRYKVTKNR